MDLMTLTRRQRKHAVRQMLTTRDAATLQDWAGRDGRVLESLYALLFEQEELVRWRAIEALGNVAAIMADRDIASVRELLRRLLWSMNDESGAAGWHSPEAIGAILARVPELIEEFGPIVASYLGEEPFERGAHWAVARLARLCPKAFSEFVAELTESIDADDPVIRIFAADALAALGVESSIPRITRLASDEALVTLYDAQDGKMVKTTVGEMAKSALASIV